jgi:hypothetical protein
MLIRSALFWDITRRRVAIVYRRFVTTYRSHLHGARVRAGKKESQQHFFPTRTLDPWRWDWYVVTKRRYTITTRRRVISQKSADLNLNSRFTRSIFVLVSGIYFVLQNVVSFTNHLARNKRFLHACRSFLSFNKWKQLTSAIYPVILKYCIYIYIYDYNFDCSVYVI